MRLFISLFFIILLKTAHAGTAVSGDNKLLVDEIYTCTYRFQFTKADSLISANDPVHTNDLDFNLAVINYYWWRLISGEQNGGFSALLKERIEKVKIIHKQTVPDADEAKLFLLISIYAYSARVSLLDYSYYAALTDLSNYYSVLKKSFGHEADYKPFYLTSGLYYFFAGYAREKLPVLSPLLYFYESGNKETGMLYIKLAGISDDWKIRQEAMYFLMKINFDIYGNYSEAAKYCKQLLAIYPGNLLYQWYQFRISIALDQLTDAKARLSIMERTASGNSQLSSDEKEYYIKLAKAELHGITEIK